MPRYTRCPYYIDENNMTISCEDVCRSYDSLDDKWAWMDMYCDTWDWQKCPYALDMTEAYRKAEEGDSMAIENHEKKAAKNEIRSLSTKLGMAKKKNERLTKRLMEEQELVKSYQRRNEALLRENKDYYKRWREAQGKLDKGNEQIHSELSTLANIYEQRMAFLIDTYCPDKKLYDEDAEAWAKDREFALVFDNEDVDSSPFRRTWKVVFKEDGQQDQDIQAEEQK